MISVIITTNNNRAQMCKRAIESVLAQTYPDFEIIVVDDASTDDTESIVASFKDERVKYFKRKRSHGIQAIPKNKGIRVSKGEYIAFLDSDNTYRPDHLRILLKEFETTPGLDVAYGDRWVHGDSEGIGIFNDFSLSHLLKRNYIDTSDALIKREALYYVGGWDERFKRFADWNLFLRLAKAGFNFKRVPQIITDYYICKDSLSFKPENLEVPMMPLWDPYDCEIRLPHLGDIPSIKVAVFSITYDRLDYTKKSFASLYKTANYPIDHYIVDNGSKDGTVKWLKEHYDPKFLILNKENKGISIASNQALDAIGDKYDVILKFDNDCICLTPGWLEKMVEVYKSNHMLALSCYVQGLKDNPGGAQRMGYGRVRGELLGITMHLGGICHFAPFKAYEGWRWPEDEQLHGLQDVEFSRYLLNKGYQMGYLENFFISHGPLGTDAQLKDYPKYFERRKEEKLKTYEKNN